MYGASGGVSVKAGPSAKPSGRRKAQREAQRRAKMRSSQRDQDGPEFRRPDAAFVCGNCGRLGWPPARATDPLRRDAMQTRPELPPCPHCKEELWLDLGLATTALALRDHEDEAVRARRSLVTRAGGLAAIGSVFGWFLGLAAGGGVLCLLIALAMAAIGALVVVRDHAQRHDRSELLPRRWSMASFPTQSLTAVQGPIELLAEPLRAPLSGRPCVAWEVGVRRDRDAEAPLGSWELLEQRIAAATVKGRCLDPEATMLDMPRRHFGTTPGCSLDDAAQVFLRRRGFGDTRFEAELYETIVEVGEGVALSEEDGHTSVLRPADKALTAGTAKALAAASPDRSAGKK